MALPGRRSTSWSAGVRSNTFVVCGLAGYVAFVYVVIVVAGGRIAGHSGSPNLILSIAATATVAISFEAVQAGLERAATRVFGLRASPYVVLSRFAGTAVHDTTDDLPLRMARLLAEGTGAAAAQVWLMGADRPVLAAVWPATSDANAAVLDGQALISAHGWRSLPVRDGPETLGVLTVREDEHRPLSPVEERLFAGLASQAGLVLRSTRLRAERSARLVELSARAAELHASRERLIETQDEERRSLERDIHDGAQQDLVALAVNLRLADTLLVRSPSRAAGVLAQQSDAAQRAIDNLTQLARGIYPAVLAEHGLVPALAAVRAVGDLRVELNADPSIEVSPAVAAALYFCTLEALQNAAKHSGGTLARVSLARGVDSVLLSVRDDGAGLTSGATLGAGLANIRERIDAVGGTVRITGSTGHGTSVDARVPLSVSAAAS